MIRQDSLSFSSLAEFIVHAQALEQELAERYAEMADCMEIHNNPVVSRLFRELADYGESRAGRLQRQIAGREPPRVPPWEYQWLGIETPGPEECMQQLHYLMSPYHALQLALRVEQGVCTFYLRTVEDIPDAQVQILAGKLLADVRHQLSLLQTCMNRQQTNHDRRPEDLDPPHMPE